MPAGEAEDGAILTAKAESAAADAAVRVATESPLAANSLPEALTVGKNAEKGVHVYTGVRNGKDVYAVSRTIYRGDSLSTPTGSWCNR